MTKAGTGVSKRNQRDEPDDGAAGARVIEAAVTADSFQPVGKRSTTSRFVLGQIVSLLGEGKLKPGDRLPAERDLAAILGIGRPSVREALAALVLLGVIEQRQGRGTFLVERIDRLPVEPYLYQLMLAEGRILEDLLEVRLLLEPAIAALAAQRATPSDLAELAGSFGRFEQLVESNADADAEAVAGTDFHAALARASGNQTLSRLIDSLRDLLSATGSLLNERESGTSLEAHRAIADAVLARDATKAERLMRSHLEDVAGRLRGSDD